MPVWIQRVSLFPGQTLSSLFLSYPSNVCRFTVILDMRNGQLTNRPFVFPSSSSTFFLFKITILSVALTSAGRARVKWETPKTVMIVTKPGDESLLKITREIAKWMIASRGLTVYAPVDLTSLFHF